jgi:hypothetical protein
MRRLLLPPLLALAIIAAACGADGSSDTTSPTTTTPPGTQVPLGNDEGVLLQLSYEGGFAPAEFIVNRVPAITLFTDGTLLSEGPTPAIFPGPALPNIQESVVDEKTMTDIQEMIDIIGFSDFTELRNNDAANFVADANDTVVRYFDGNGEHVFSVYALGIGALPNDPGRQVPDEILNLGLLVDLLNNASFTGASEPYQPTALQLVMLENAAPADPQFANSRPWPFGDLTIGDFVGNGFLSCATIDGAAAANAVAALAGANSVTTYELDGTEHHVLARPLIPGETPCAMLDRLDR